jgi:hypothetical protein
MRHRMLADRGDAVPDAVAQRYRWPSRALWPE